MTGKNDWLLIIGLVAFAVLGGGVAAVGYTSVVKRFAQAIANQEGFNVSGSIPQRYNNPGDLTQDLNGRGIGVGDQGIIIYNTPEDGWDALYTQVSMMFNGTSQYYDPSMTITQIAKTYAANWVPWANNVSNYLGVSPDTPIGDLT